MNKIYPHFELESCLLGGLRDESLQDGFNVGLVVFAENNGDQEIVGRLKFYVHHETK
jgi:hypothetical protein